MPRKYRCAANYAPCPLLFKASTTFSGLIGNSLIRTPMASLTAFAIVAKCWREWAVRRHLWHHKDRSVQVLQQ